MERTRRRIAAALVLVLVSLPVSGATCLAFCPFAVNPAAGAAETRLTTAQPAHCHEPAGAGGAVRTSPAACPEGLRASSAVAEAPRAARADQHVVVLSAATPPFAPAVTPATDPAPLVHRSRPPRTTAAAQAPTILRI